VKTTLIAVAISTSTLLDISRISHIIGQTNQKKVGV